MSTEPKHLRRKGKALLISRIKKDRKSRCELKGRLGSLITDVAGRKSNHEPKCDLSDEEGVELDEVGLEKLGKDAVIDVLVAVRRDILAGESHLAILESKT